jgi:hypothetical protein
MRMAGSQIGSLRSAPEENVKSLRKWTSQTSAFGIFHAPPYGSRLAGEADGGVRAKARRGRIASPRIGGGEGANAPALARCQPAARTAAFFT